MYVEFINIATLIIILNKTENYIFFIVEYLK